MEKENLCCIVVGDKNYADLNVFKLNELKEELVEIDLEKKLWRNISSPEWRNNDLNWVPIGKSGFNHVRLVFDVTNFEHIKNAIAISGNFFR